MTTDGKTEGVIVACGGYFSGYTLYVKDNVDRRRLAFPILLVLENGCCRFDVEAGRDELENRRIGHNELLTIANLHERDAQREYRSARRDGTPPAGAAVPER